MDVEAKPALASRNIEIQAAVAEVQVPRRAERIIDSAEHLPIGMRAHPKAAEIAVCCQSETVTELAVIARADQRIGPAAAGVHARAGKQTRVEPYPRGKPPGTEAEAGVGELHRVF